MTSARAPLVFPVRVAWADQAVQGTTREVSLEGLLIRSLAPPPPGTALRLKLYLPGAATAADLDASCLRLEPGGFWAAFTDLPDEVAGRLRDAIEPPRKREASSPVPLAHIALQHARVSGPHTPLATPAAQASPMGPPDDDPQNRRVFPRLPARFAVRFSSVQEFVLEYAANISAGGVFVLTDRPPPMDSVVTVSLELPDGGPPVTCRGLVVHRVPLEEAAARGAQAGAGVQFVEADDAFRARIDGALARILGKGPG